MVLLFSLLRKSLTLTPIVPRTTLNIKKSPHVPAEGKCKARHSRYCSYLHSGFNSDLKVLSVCFPHGEWREGESEWDYLDSLLIF